MGCVLQKENRGLRSLWCVRGGWTENWCLSELPQRQLQPWIKWAIRGFPHRRYGKIIFPLQQIHVWPYSFCASALTPWAVLVLQINSVTWWRYVGVQANLGCPLKTCPRRSSAQLWFLSGFFSTRTNSQMTEVTTIKSKLQPGLQLA